MLGTGHALVTECYNTCFVISDSENHFLVDGGGGNTILKQLKDAGMDTMTGASAEILVDSVREQICPNKLNSQEWVDVIKEAECGICVPASDSKALAEAMHKLIKTPEIISSNSDFSSC